MRKNTLKADCPACRSAKEMAETAGLNVAPWRHLPMGKNTVGSLLATAAAGNFYDIVSHRGIGSVWHSGSPLPLDAVCGDVRIWQNWK